MDEEMTDEAAGGAEGSPPASGCLVGVVHAFPAELDAGAAVSGAITNIKPAFDGAEHERAVLVVKADEGGFDEIEEVIVPHIHLGNPPAADEGLGEGDPAGHHPVKMVHNGIEHADMQSIAETYDVLRFLYGLSASAMADVFEAWREGDLASQLIDATIAVPRRMDVTGGRSLIDLVLDDVLR